MTTPPRIGRRKPSEQFERYAESHRKAAWAHASILSSTRDDAQKKRYEEKLQKNRDQASFYDEKARNAREAGD